MEYLIVPLDFLRKNNPRYAAMRTELLANVRNNNHIDSWATGPMDSATIVTVSDDCHEMIEFIEKYEADPL